MQKQTDHLCWQVRKKGLFLHFFATNVGRRSTKKGERRVKGPSSPFLQRPSNSSVPKFMTAIHFPLLLLHFLVLVRPRRTRRGRAFQGEAEQPPEEEEKTVTTLPVPPLLPHCSKSHPRSPDPTTIKVPGRAKETTTTRRIRRKEKIYETKAKKEAFPPRRRTVPMTNGGNKRRERGRQILPLPLPPLFPPSSSAD